MINIWHTISAKQMVIPNTLTIINYYYVLEKKLSGNKEDGGCMGGPHFLWYHRENRQSEKNFNVWQVKFVDSCLKVFSFIHFSQIALKRYWLHEYIIGIFWLPFIYSNTIYFDMRLSAIKAIEYIFNPLKCR